MKSAVFYGVYLNYVIVVQLSGTSTSVSFMLFLNFTFSY